MLGDLRKKMLEKEREIQQRIEALRISSESSDKTVSAVINGRHQIVELHIELEKIDSAELLEDLLLVCLNKGHQEINDKSAALMRHDLHDLLPPGLDKIFG